MLPMDAVLMEQVLMNLLENVVDHSGGTEIIWVSLEREGDFGVFSVRDQGRGVDASVLSKIFSGSMTSNYGSSGDSKRNMGIGLSVCHTIVKAHQGNMEVRNVDSGGAEFRVLLPLEENCDE